jgi:hypothetical protein
MDKFSRNIILIIKLKSSFMRITQVISSQFKNNLSYLQGKSACHTKVLLKKQVLFGKII